MTDKAETPAAPEEETAAAEDTEQNQQTELESEIAALQQELEAVRQKADENYELAVRAQAELENVRRRAERDLENAHKFALEKFMHELLPIKDSLEMGLAAAQTDEVDVQKLREGSELILKMLAGALEKFGVAEMDPMGEPFDPEHHQAMSLLESPEHAPDTVVMVMQKGYKLNDRLIRPAMVAVAKPPENQENNLDEKA